MWVYRMNYKGWVMVAAGLFVAGIVMGVITSQNAPEESASQLLENMSWLQGILAALASLPPPLLALVIFLNNLFTLVTNYVFSPLLCLVPVLALMLNGWLAGFVAAAAVEETSLMLVLGGLLPHGVFEIPAFIMGEAAALSAGTSLMLALFHQESRATLVPRLKESLKYLLVALALLVPAAIMEVYVSAPLLNQGG